MKGRDVLKALSHINERTINLSEEKKTLDSNRRFKRYSLVAASVLILVISGLYLRDGFFLNPQEERVSYEEKKAEYKEEAKVDMTERSEESNATIYYNDIAKVDYDVNDTADSLLKREQMTDSDVVATMKGFYDDSSSDVYAYFIEKEDTREFYKITSHVEEHNLYILLSISPNSQFVNENYKYVNEDTKKTYIGSTEVTVGNGGYATKKDYYTVYTADFVIDGYRCYIECEMLGDGDVGREQFEIVLKNYIEVLHNNIDVIKAIK